MPEQTESDRRRSVCFDALLVFTRCTTKICNEM